MEKLFISHAAHDKPLVEAVVDLLESGVGVPHNRIFCSSLKGQSIKPGEDFVDSIRKNLDQATCVLSLISEAYYASAFCMCELGGVWLATKSFLPVLVPPVEFSSLKAVLGKLQVSKIANEEDLDELRDELVSRLALEGHKTPRWNSKRKAFLLALPALLKQIHFEGPVARDQYEKLQLDMSSYKEGYEELEAKLAERNELIEDLKKTKDGKAVAKVVREHSSAIDAFESLVEEAERAVSSLAHPVQEALYYYVRDEDYHPKGEDAWDEVKQCLEHGELELNSDDNGVCPRQNHPRVGKALAALDALRLWLREVQDEEFSSWYEGEADGELPDLTLRSFWKLHLR